MRSVLVKSSLSVALIAAFAPMQVAADVYCNLGTVTNPSYVACGGIFSINPPDGYPADLEELLTWMNDREWWQPPIAEADWTRFSPVIESWDSDSYSKTEFDELGFPDDGPHGPFESYLWGEDGGGAFWTLTFATGFRPYWGIFAILLKQAGEYGVFLFEVPENQAVTDIRFELDYWNSLSHAGLFGGETTTVPEPSSMLLLASGLLGLGFVGYRRRRK